MSQNNGQEGDGQNLMENDQQPTSLPPSGSSSIEVQPPPPSTLSTTTLSTIPQQEEDTTTTTLTLESNNNTTQQEEVPPLSSNDKTKTTSRTNIQVLPPSSSTTTKQQQPISPTNGALVIASPTSVVKPIETKDWQVDFSKFPIVDTDLMKQASKKKLRKKVSKFYEKQNELIEGYAELYTNTVTKEFLKDSDEEGEGKEGESFLKDNSSEENNNKEALALEKKQSRYASFCIQASFWVNVILLFLKVSASLLSMSLSVITSTIDSVLDLVSGLILFYTNMLKKKKSDLHMYPAGKERLEPLGFIIFATCMSTASLQIIKEGFVGIITGLVTGNPYLPTDTQNIVEWIMKPELLNGEMEWMLGIKIPSTFKMVFFIYGLFVLFIAIFLKAILYLLCIRAKDSPSCEAYAFDHRNDVLSNTFLIISLFVSQWVWWLDPFGATLLSIFIIYGWVGESMEHVSKLVGLTAESEFIKKLTFIAVNQSEKIMKVETVTAWYSGVNIIAEIHVVLPPNMSLREAHNIGEDLQMKIESVPEVERCFVHLDFNDNHKINK